MKSLNRHAATAVKVLDAIKRSAGAKATATVTSRRCFPLKEHHVMPISPTNNPPTPKEFHSHLLHALKHAKHRVHLASLYIGPAASSSANEEHELLDALTDIAANKPHIEVKLLMDYNRALRPVKTTQHDTHTSSAEAIYSAIRQTRPSSSQPCALYLFKPSPHSLLPSPLNEVAGVFHLKCYIIDDTLILSGANLSLEYFTDRQDRYTYFTNGGGGLVDFYVDLVHVLCQHAHIYGDQHLNQKVEDRKGLIESISNLMKQKETGSTNDNDVVAYAFPTFQAPSMQSSSNDVSMTQQLLSIAAKEECSIQLASAYLNPTRTLLQELSKFTSSTVQLLTASPTSHGFAPKQGMKRKGDWVPQIFSTISKSLAETYNVLWYSRPGWTFHAKGLWVTSKDGSLVAAMVGSGNYGYRSWHRDLESNVILVFPQRTSLLQQRLQQEWLSLGQYATPLEPTDGSFLNLDPKSIPHFTPAMIQASLPLIQRFF